MAIVKQLVKPLSLSPHRKKREGDLITNENFVESISETGTVDLGIDVELVNASDGAITRTIPSPDFEGQSIFIKKTDSSVNAVTIDTEGDETIDGEDSQSLDSQYDSIEAVTDGDDWFIRDRVLNENVVSTVTEDTTLGVEDLILADGSSNTVTNTLPTPDSEGQSYTIKAIDISSAVDVVTEGSETIDGAASYTFTTQYDSIKVESDGDNWFITAEMLNN